MKRQTLHAPLLVLAVVLSGAFLQACGPAEPASRRGRVAHAASRVAAPTSAHLGLDEPPLDSGGGAGDVRAAYFYDYVSYYHLDSLAAAGLNRALVKFISDTLRTKGKERLRGWMGRADRSKVEVVPSFNAQNRYLLQALPTARRYTWGSGTVESQVACPLDSVFLRAAVRDRALEMFTADARVRRLLLDLEIYNGGIHHYDRGPCRCVPCLGEFAAAGAGSDLESFQEARLATLIEDVFSDLRLETGIVELGVLDLDYDSFVHRAVGRAALYSGLPVVCYTERSYSSAAQALSAVRAGLQPLSSAIPIVAGLWLQRHAPPALETATRDLMSHSGGYFLFTSYSLWQDPALLTGPYTLQGTQQEYWQALRAANR